MVRGDAGNVTDRRDRMSAVGVTGDSDESLATVNRELSAAASKEALNAGCFWFSFPEVLVFSDPFARSGGLI